jgi:SOS response regulatory protein OraA/RecX
VDEIYAHALKLLQARDYTVLQLNQKLRAKFGTVPQEVVDRLIQKKFLNDRRFAENYVARRKNRGPGLLREELLARGVPPALADEILSQIDLPSLKEALTSKMIDWKLCAPLQLRDSTRLFRALSRLGYDEDAIREEIEQVRERQ